MASRLSRDDGKSCNRSTSHFVMSRCFEASQERAEAAELSSEVKTPPYVPYLAAVPSRGWSASRTAMRSGRGGGGVVVGAGVMIGEGAGYRLTGAPRVQRRSYMVSYPLHPYPATPWLEADAYQITGELIISTRDGKKLVLNTSKSLGFYFSPKSLIN